MHNHTQLVHREKGFDLLSLNHVGNAKDHCAFSQLHEWHAGTRRSLPCSIATCKSTTTTPNTTKHILDTNTISTVSKHCKIQLLINSLSSLQKRGGEQYSRAHARMLVSSLCNLILLHLSKTTSVCNTTGNIGGDHLLEVSESSNIGLVVRDVCFCKSAFDSSIHTSDSIVGRRGGTYTSPLLRSNSFLGPLHCRRARRLPHHRTMRQHLCSRPP